MPSFVVVPMDDAQKRRGPTKRDLLVKEYQVASPFPENKSSLISPPLFGRTRQGSNAIVRQFLSRLKR